MKSTSIPVYPPISRQNLAENELKKEISAPSYLYSLAKNQLPPYIKPVNEPRPYLIIGTIMNEADAIEMITASDEDPEVGLKCFLGKFLIYKKVILNYKTTEKAFLSSFLKETIDYAAQREFSAYKLACLITIYLSTHIYFKWYYWIAPAAVWCYFKELMIRHSIEDSPDGQEVFEPEESYDISTHFHAMYITNLPLVHILTFGCSRLKYEWNFKPK